SRLSYPLGLVILFMSITIASNFQEHLHEGMQIVPLVLQMPLFTIMPLLLLVIAFLKNRDSSILDSLIFI
ncbi:hypothetical protein CHH47_29430, partial [Priestia megaterium]